MTSPVPAIPTFTDGLRVRQAQLNALATLTSNLYSADVGGFRTKPPMCAVRLTSTTQNVAFNTDSQVTWDVADINTDNMWTSGSPAVMTVNTPGTYWMFTQVATDGSQTQLGLRLVVNGLTPAINSVTTFSAKANAGCATAVVPLTAGAVISTFVYQSNGSSSATLQTTFGSCRMAAVFISP